MGAGLFSRAVPYQASPWPPGQVRLSRASVRSDPGVQRGEAITCRDRKSRENAEGHANAEPQILNIERFRIRVCSPIFDT
jgi:hypothetical protein